MNWTLPGVKSYLIGFAIILVSGLHAQGYISDQTYAVLLGLLNGGAVMALRAAIAKAGGAK
jgi:hypothetical protein